MVHWLNFSLLVTTIIFSQGCLINKRVEGISSISPDSGYPPDNGSNPNSPISGPLLNLFEPIINNSSFIDMVFTWPFDGDNNSNATLKLYLCSVRTERGCDPLAGTSYDLVRGNTAFDITVNMSSLLIDSGDYIKYQLVPTDTDGYTLGTVAGYSYFPYSPNSPQKITQLNSFFLSRDYKGSLDFTGGGFPAGVKLDSLGNMFIFGSTGGSISEPNGGSQDFFVAKIKSNGEFDTKFGFSGVTQLGLVSVKDSLGYEFASDIATDNNGDLYLIGNTSSNLGGPSGGSYDGVIVKINAQTGLLDRSFGNGDGQDNDGILQLNNVNASNANGYETFNSIAIGVDGFGYVLGSTPNALGGSSGGGTDGFVLKFNTTTGQLASTFGDGDGSDGDGILHFNNLNSGSTTSSELFNSILLDSFGHIFVSGSTFSAMGGPVSGTSDIVLIKLLASSGAMDTSFGNGDGADNDGILKFNSNFTAGAIGYESNGKMVLYGTNEIYIGGQTDGAMGGVNSGFDDIFVIKVNGTTGVLDTSFGNGDGTNNDGVLQINNINATDASGYDELQSITIGANGKLHLGGVISTAMGGPLSGSYDNVIFQVDNNTGALSTSFGNGDGSDSDGILQINDMNSNSNGKNGYGGIYSMVVNTDGNLIAVGNSQVPLGGTNSVGNDLLIFKVSNSTGSLSSDFGNGDGIDGDGIFQINPVPSGISYSSSSMESVYSMTKDSSGNFYIAGSTMSSLGGAFSGISEDGFIAKFNSYGHLDLTFGNGDGRNNDGILQINNYNSFSPSDEDRILSIQADSSGNIYAGGRTRSSLGGANSGNIDGFILKVNGATGALDTSFGNGDGINNDGILQFNVVNTSGNSASNDIIESISIDESNGYVFAVGHSEGGLGGTLSGLRDGLVIKVNSTSGLLDLSFGSGDGIDSDGILHFNNLNTNSASSIDHLYTSALGPAGYLFVAGQTFSSMGGTAAGPDGVVIKINTSTGAKDTGFGNGDGINSDGILQFTNTNSNSATGTDKIVSIQYDSIGGYLFLGGSTTSSLGGVNGGSYDAFVAKVSGLDGTKITTFGNGDGINSDGILQLNNTNTSSSAGFQEVHSLVIDTVNNVFYLAGETSSAFGGTAAGSYDAYVIKGQLSTGLLESSFGSGDGNDNDGIFQLNNSNTKAANNTEIGQALVISNNGDIILGGQTGSSLKDFICGTQDAFFVRINAATGNLTGQ